MKSIQLFVISLFVSVFSIHVNAQFCTGGFTDSIDSLDVYFTNQATGPYNFMLYDFGDGNFVTQVNDPVHSYNGPGLYEVCQMIQDTNGFCFDFTCDTLAIGGATCGAGFFYWENGGDVEFIIDALGTYDSVMWDFGDGNTSTDTMPVHTYSQPGQYYACLSLYSGGSICNTFCDTVYFFGGSSCTADFSASVNGSDVQFTDLSNGNYTDIYWDFGDGFGTSTQANPSYTYLIPGTYTVCLEISDQFSCFDFYCQDVTITGGGGGGGCQANFTANTDQLSVSCQNTSTGNYTTAIWNWGDGSLPGLDPTHTYDEPGTYEVCLTITNLLGGCFSNYCQEITVNEYTCEASFTYTWSTSNVFQFSNTSTGTYSSAEWDFGDGNTSTFASPAYTYNLPGTYEVCLTVFDGTNACGVTCEELEVYPLGVENPKSNRIQVYPNPSNGEITVDLGSNYSDVSGLTIVDISGRVVFQQQNPQSKQMHQLDLDLKAGSYFLQVMSETGTSSEVIMIQ